MYPYIPIKCSDVRRRKSCVTDNSEDSRLRKCFLISVG